MSKVKIEGNASGTGTLTISAPNTDTDRSLTLPDGAGEILTDASTLSSSNLSGALPAIDGSALTGIDASGPAFSAYMSSTQSVSANTWTKLVFDTEHFDTDSDYDTSTYRFTPSKAGYYQVSINAVSAQGSGSYNFIAMYKNGAKFGGQSGVWILNTALDDSHHSHSVLVSMNGTTDYVEAWGVTDISSYNFSASSSATNFSAVWIRGN